MPDTTLGIRLRDVPTEHLRLVRHALRVGQHRPTIDAIHAQQGWRPIGTRPGFVRAITAPPPWWVSPEVCDVVDGARTTMPVHALHTADVPQAHGVMYFGTALSGLIDNTVQPAAVSAIGWLRTPDGIIVLPWALVRPDGRRAWIQLAAVLWPWNEPSDSDEASSSTIEDLHRLSCVWALAAEPRITTPRSEPVRGQAQRRAKRAGVHVHHVVAIDLRGVSRGSTGHSDSARAYTHRWIVRGHWRQQAVGPGGTQRRPTYIAAHIKGPADKPLLPSSPVKVVR